MRDFKRASLHAVACLLALAAAGCAKEKLVATACREDSACEAGQLCDNFRCVPAAAKACENVTDGNPILQPSPYSMAFGDLDVQSATQQLTLHNIGNCTLTLFEAQMGKGTTSPFASDLLLQSFPIEIFPGRSRDFTVEYKATGVGRAADELRILSDDKEFAELQIPFTANYLGAPLVRVTPNPIDFGYVPQGRSGTVNVNVTNQGTGVAPITIEKVEFSVPDTQDFGLVQPLAGPVTLAPLAQEPTAQLALQVRYTPRTTAKHALDLVLRTSKGDVLVPVQGNAETPPKLKFNPTSIDLGDVPLGTTNLQALTLTNEGGAPLQVQLKWGGPSPNTDLFTTPVTLAPIAAGQYTEIQVGFTATAVGPVTGLLLLTTNDPAKPQVTIPVTANGTPGAGPEVVKVEMVFENGSDSFFDNDVRNVDLTLEHPFGYVCNKQYPNPTNWGVHGKPTWMAFGVKEEPERIVLADAQVDGTWRAMVQYQESCASLPTGLVAGILGISTELLVAYLSGGAIPINGQDVAKLIEQMCVSRPSTSATVRVYVNGTLKKEKTVSLAKKGDATYAVDIIRTNGQFTAN